MPLRRIGFHASKAAMEALAEGIRRFGPADETPAEHLALWIETASDQVWRISSKWTVADDHPDYFVLAIDDADQGDPLGAMVLPGRIPDDFLGGLMDLPWRPAFPLQPPTNLAPWPFDTFTMSVLVFEERFDLSSDASGDALDGVDGCEIAAGLLFESSEGSRLAVIPSAPAAIRIVNDDASIGEILDIYPAISLVEYFAHFSIVA